MKKQNRCIHKILRDFKILSLVDHTTNVLYYIYQSEKLYQSTNHLILVTLIFHHNFHNKPLHNNTLSVSLRFFVLFRALFTLCTLSFSLHVKKSRCCCCLPHPFRGMGAWRKTMEPQKPGNSPGSGPEVVKRQRVAKD